jgi:hypothetical protein
MGPFLIAISASAAIVSNSASLISSKRLMPMAIA